MTGSLSRALFQRDSYLVNVIFQRLPGGTEENNENSPSA
jgi:hypothetical protein